METGVRLTCPECGEAAVDEARWRCGSCGYQVPLREGFACFSPDSSGAGKDYDRWFFSELGRIEEGHFWFEARNRLILFALRRHLRGMERFLEIGCGTGFVLRAIRRKFPGVRLFGAEIHLEGLKIAAGRVPDAGLLQFDARNAPFVSCLDGVGMFDVLEHIDEDETVLRQVHKALGPRGGLILTVPQHGFLWSAIDDVSLHKRRYSRGELVDKVTRAGFRVRFTTSFASLVLPLMWLARWIKRKKVDDSMAEFKIGRAANALLSLAFAVERFLITGLGLSLPAGGSLLVVAVKDEAENG